MLEFIKNWYIINEIESKTKKSFWRNFDIKYKYLITDSSFCKRDINLVFEDICFEMCLPDFSKECISVYVLIIMKEEQIGRYKQSYFLDGSIDNYYFDIF